MHIYDSGTLSVTSKNNLVAALPLIRRLAVMFYEAVLREHVVFDRDGYIPLGALC